MKVIKAGKLILKDCVKENQYLYIKDGKIEKITEEAPEEYIDYSNYYVAPGYVDTHIHGYGGKDIMDGTKEALDTISKGIVENGVTSYLPTTLTASMEDLDRAVKNVGDHYKEAPGAKIHGIFLEGPFFTEKYKGAQNPKYMSDPDIEILRHWQELSGNMIKKIAIAPERKGSVEFTKKAREMGVYVALGHSDATYDEAYEAVMAGANIFVHLFNGMSGLHHRNPGMVGAGLSLDQAYCELICDGHHLHPAAIRVAKNAKGYEKAFLITDCMMAGGIEEGQYKLGEFDVTVKDGTARLDSGSLAGSILRLKDGVENIIDWEIASVFEAVQMASQIPAKSVGIDDRCGIIEEGRDADLNILDEKGQLVKTYLNGEEWTA